MPTQVDPYAYANAFGATVQRGQSEAAMRLQALQQQAENERANRGMALQEQSAGLQRQQFDRQGQQMQSEQDQFKRERMSVAAQQIGGLARQALASGNPSQAIRGYLSNPAYQQLLQDVGVDPAAVNPDDPKVIQQLQSWVAFAPKESAPYSVQREKTPEGMLYSDGSRFQLIQPEKPQQPSVPAGYRPAAGGKLEPIPGGPADPNTPNTKDDSRIFAKADKLRDEFNAQSKEFITVNDSYNVVQETARNPSAAGDLSLIFAYMKMLDPNSVVREQEFANAQNAAGVPDRVRNAYNKALNGERLNPDQRKDFISQAAGVYNTRKQRQDSVTKRYSEIATRNQVNPQDVVGDLSVIMGGPKSNAPVRVSTPEEAMKLPPGTMFITPDGRQKVR